MRYFIISVLVMIICGCSSQKKFVAPPFGGGVEPVNYSSISLGADTSLVASMDSTYLYVPPPIVKEKFPLRDRVLKRIAETASKLFLPPAKSSGDGAAVVSLVLGLVGLVIFGIVLGILAIIFGATALSKGTSKRNLAIAGIVMGILSILVWLVFLTIMITASPI